MSDGAVRVTTVVAVEAGTAWDVFTRDVDAWWRRGPRFRWRHDRDGELRFEGGEGGRLVEAVPGDAEQDFEVGRIRVWEPGRRLVFDFRVLDFAPHEVTQVEVRFEPADGGTRVTVEHRGWQALAGDHPARRGLDGTAFDALIGTWWADLLGAARRRAEAAAGRG
jgi:hypothetical protein